MQIWKEWGHAKAQPSGGRVGQRNLSEFLIEQMTAITIGIDKFKTYRPVAEVASVAWGYLDEKASDNA